MYYFFILGDIKNEKVNNFKENEIKLSAGNVFGDAGKGKNEVSNSPNFAPKGSKKESVIDASKPK